MSDAIRTLGQVSVEYATRADEYATLAREAAVTEAEYRSARAKYVVRVRMEDPKASVAWAETQADADDEIAALLYRRLVAAAAVDAAARKLAQLRERIATGRTIEASAREVDKIHAIGVHS